MPPSPPVQVDWVILQRFASADAASAGFAPNGGPGFWTVPSRCWSGGTICIWCGTTAAGVRPVARLGRDLDPRQAWPGGGLPRVGAADRGRAGRVRGLQGYRFEPPIPGVQDDWLAILRFDTDRDLQAWLDSPERRKLIEEAEPFMEEFHARVVRTGFDQWFPAEGDRATAPAAWKQNMLVLLMLYPVVFLFGLWVQTPILMGKAGLPFWLALFIGNIVSVLLLNWLVPWTSRGFGWWLAPSRNGGRTNIVGAILVISLYAACLLVFSRL